MVTASAERQRKRYAADPKAHCERSRERRFKSKYGITVAQRDAMLAEQGDACKICRCTKPPTIAGWHIDHCHESKIVRGILCHHCNLLLGVAKDNIGTLAAAINYLKETSWKKF